MQNEIDSVLKYDNVYSSCYKKDKVVITERIKEHVFIYIESGLLQLKHNNKEYKFPSGDCVFIRRSYDVQLIKKPLNNNGAFAGVFFVLDKKFLASKFKKYKNLNCDMEKEPIIRIEKHPVLTSFFNTFISYRKTGMEPDQEVIEAKKYEALDTLLKIKPSLVKSLFDFAKPWKISLEDFMNKNFTNDMTLEDFAHYTGRSLSTFKRDFKEIFNENPHEWLKNKKLEEAYKLMTNYRLRPSEVYMDLGFKSFSHFSNSFKEKFGVNPTSLLGL